MMVVVMHSCSLPPLLCHWPGLLRGLLSTVVAAAFVVLVAVVAVVVVLTVRLVAVV